MRLGFAIYFFCALGFAQTTKRAFDVVSVKIASGQDDHYDIDDAQIDVGGTSMTGLLIWALHVPAGRLHAPQWSDSVAYDVRGKLPPGSTKKQVPEMLQSMLMDRFGLQFHVEHKTESAYELRIGSGPLNLRPSPAPASPRDEFNCVMSGDHHPCHLMTMENLALMLSTLADAWRRAQTVPTWAIDRPVVDATGLTGEYDFEIIYGSSKRDPADPDAKRIVDGVKELGLKLEPVKHEFEYIVIDHLERVPTEN